MCENIKNSVQCVCNPVCVKMSFVKQPIDIPVRTNRDWEDPTINTKMRKHSSLLPDSIRCIIAGPSNCGKTNLLINLIVSEHGLKFENVYVYSKTLWQPKYMYLEQLFKPIQGIEYHQFASTSDKVIEPKDVRPNSIVIFDDVISEKNQDIIKQYFSLGRHGSVDSFYLTTTYARVSKHLIRDNCNFLIFFRQDELNLRHIFNDMSVGCHMKFEQFQRFCYECWGGGKYGFAVIDLDSEVDGGRYRKGFADYLVL